MACDDDIPRHTVGLADAEGRLNAAVNERVPYHYTDGAGHKLITVRAEDVQLVLRELHGLKQFDPR